MPIITKSISKSVSNQKFQKSIATQLKPQTVSVLIGSIPISTYFGDDIINFYNQYKDQPGVTSSFNPDINFTNSNYKVISIDKKFRSDGLSINDRAIRWDDVIDIYANIMVPVQYDYNYSAENFFHLDFNPSPGHRYTVAEDHFHQWIPGDVDTVKSFEEKDKPTNELLAKQIHVYLRPTSIYHNTNNSLELIEGTTNIQAIYHTDEEHWFEPDDYYYDPTMLRIGKFQVQANSSIDKDMVILDTRTRGGGLDEALPNDLIQRVNQESMYHWDIGYHDGMAYQENGVFIIRLPRSILNDFTETDVQNAIAKYKAYGTLPIVEYYDPEPVDYNIIQNFDFKNSKHIGQYNPALSNGNYVIDVDNSDHDADGILKIMKNAKYSITIPSTQINFASYLISIKARLDANSSQRKVAAIHILYESGITETISMGTVTSTSWIVYQKEITPKSNLVKIDIVLNEDGSSATGNLFIDYVEMVPVFSSNENLEIIEV